MKRIILSISLVLASLTIYAQTWAEWFQQDGTQKKYLLQQIAALQLYIGYIEKGYSLATKGLNMINDIKHGELNLHSDYFTSLKMLNPGIRDYAKVIGIISIQLKIAKLYKKTMAQFSNSIMLNDKEKGYLRNVLKLLMDDCSRGIDDLIIVTTSNQIQMKDDERLERIDSLYLDMMDRYAFVQSFSDEASILKLLRRSEQKSIETSRVINGIK